jgi:hypothetical protein
MKETNVKCIFSLLCRYDFHFIVKALSQFGDAIKNLRVLPYNSENFRSLMFNSFEFLDTIAFLQAPLNQLCTDLKATNHDYNILKQTYLVKSNGTFDAEKYDMVLQKSFFPYEFCTSLRQMASVTTFPSIQDFHSCLTEETISETEHNFARTVWDKFHCKTLLDYTRVYNKIDTVLLAEVFQKFRKDMHEFSGLDPAYYLSLPAFSFDSMLKLTQTIISLPVDINQVTKKVLKQ